MCPIGKSLKLNIFANLQTFFQFVDEPSDSYSRLRFPDLKPITEFR